MSQIERGQGVAVCFPGAAPVDGGPGPLAQEVPFREAWRRAEEAAGYGLSLHDSNEVRRQVATVAHSYAVYETLRSAGVKVGVILEHSLGVYAALAAAEAIDLADAIRLASEAGRLIQESYHERRGGLLAIVGLSTADVEQICKSVKGRGIAQVANYNTELQSVVGGDVAALAEVARIAWEKEPLDVVQLPISGALHTPVMSHAAQELARLMNGARVRKPSVPLLGHVGGGYVRREADVRALLAQQLEKPVLWRGCVERAIKDGFGTFVDLGPGEVLYRMVRWVDRNIKTYALFGRHPLDEVVAASVA